MGRPSTARPLNPQPHPHPAPSPPPPPQLAYYLGVQPAGALQGPEVHAPGGALVFLNGNILGVHKRPHKFVRMLRCARARGVGGRES
jgi:hypothetical protein